MEGERYANKGVRSTAYQKALILEGEWYQKDLRVMSGRTLGPGPMGPGPMGLGLMGRGRWAEVPWAEDLGPGSHRPGTLGLGPKGPTPMPESIKITPTQ